MQNVNYTNNIVDEKQRHEVTPVAEVVGLLLAQIQNDKNRILNTLRPIKFRSSRAARIVIARINIFIRRGFP